MNQSRIGSLVEACIGTAIGFAVSIGLSCVVYPMFGHAFTLAQNFLITAIFTVASVIRSYIVRRWANKHLQALGAWVRCGRLKKCNVAHTVDEYAVVSTRTRTGAIIGYWAYGNYLPGFDYLGGPALWTTK